MVDKAQKKLFFCKHIPERILGSVMLCLFFPTVYLGVKLGDTLFIIFRYGMKAYSDGLRFYDSKHGILNNGETLRWYIDIPRGTFDFIFILIFACIGISLCDLCFFLIQKKRTTNNNL